MDLFSQSEEKLERKFEIFSVKDGEILFMKNFLNLIEANEYFKVLQTSIHWRQEEIKYYGKIYPVPRKTAWYGYEGFDYSYSGINCNPEPWTTELLFLKNEIEKFLPEENFNSVLLNMYRNGNDKVSWHSDDEKELGLNPSIASLSLGETRRFDLKHKDNPELQYKFELTPGSLIIMKGALQHNWLHQIPIQKRVTQTRINLTFRTIKI
ncbi:alpha-ketoglutarate-dependent dioxygenase AlkB [Flavobacterium psychrophilum]